MYKYAVFNKNAIVQGKVTCLAASSDGGMFAVGLSSGDVEVYKISENNSVSLVYCLQSHVSQIYDLKFASSGEVLASCSEQLCFWSVPYMLNNPLAVQTTKRRSSRFSSQRSSDIEEVDAKVVPPNGNFLQVNGGRNDAPYVIQPSPWRGKQGPADKPELLACIKFDGNKAEKLFANADFTQFNTIDDEGVYYHLALQDVEENQTPFSIYMNGRNGNTHNISDDEDYYRHNDNVII